MITTVQALEEYGRTRLSPNFFMREFLHSEIAEIEGIANVPVDPDLAILAGQGLCHNVLEPIETALGRISVRSAYRSPDINRCGYEKGYACALNEKNYTRHIWDIKDEDGHYGATACILVNSFVDYYEKTGDWTALAWWIHDHVPGYREMVFYPRLAAFNINWYSGPPKERSITAWFDSPHTGKDRILTRTGMDNFAGDHSASYEPWLSTP